MIEDQDLKFLLESCTPGEWTVLDGLQKDGRVRYFCHILIGHKKKTGMPYVMVNAAYDQDQNSVVANATLVSISPQLAKEVLRLRDELKQLTSHI